jgi:hypothetical protein
MVLVEGTQSSPIFEKSADDLAERLEVLGGPMALEMAREARSLAVMFRGWAHERPADDVRINAIQSLFDLNRRAMDFMSRQPQSTPPGSGPGGPQSAPPSRPGPPSRR